MTASDITPVPAAAPSFPSAPGARDMHWKTYRSAFDAASVSEAFSHIRRLNDWPVVYVLDRPGQRAYVGETRHAVERMKQHLANPHREGLTGVQVIVDPIL